MRGVVFVGDRELEIRELPDPHAAEGEVAIAMKASGLCGSDLRPYRVPRDQVGPRDELNARGHEPCGVIAEVGPGVMMHHYIGCGTCRMCRLGYTQMCLRHHTRGGGHEDFLLAPESTCVALRDELSFEEGAACTCGTGTAFHALKRLSLTATDTLAIFGQGPVGASGTLIAATLPISQSTPKTALLVGGGPGYGGRRES